MTQLYGRRNPNVLFHPGLFMPRWNLPVAGISKAICACRDPEGTGISLFCDPGVLPCERKAGRRTDHTRTFAWLYRRCSPESEICVREKKGAEPLSEKDKRTAEEFIRKYHKNIIQTWVKFFVLKQSVRSTKITKKL